MELPFGQILWSAQWGRKWNRCYHQTPEGVTIPKASQLAFPTKNNVTEYEAFIAGQQATLQLDARHLKFLGDSKLVISQVRSEWKTKNKRLIPYQELARHLVKQLKEISFTHVSRVHNKLADSLATLASVVQMPLHRSMESFVVEKLEIPATNIIWHETRKPKEVVPVPWISP